MIKKFRDEVQSKGYTKISNHIHYNKELNLQAKYLFVLILSLPETYSISYKSLAAMTGEGEKKIKNNLEKLVEQGYLHLESTQCRDEKGKWVVGFNCEIYELPELNPRTTEGSPVSPKGRHGQKAVTAKGQTYNKNYSKKENLKEINKIISPNDSEIEKSETKKEPLPGNPKKNPSVEGKASKLAELFNETGGQGEGAAEPCPSVSTTPPVPSAMTASSLNSERIIKAIMKEYSHLDFEVLEKSIQLAFEKEISDTKSFIAYVLTILSDWNAHDFTTIDKVEKHLKRILNTTPDLTLKPYSGKPIRRYEMKPDWLTNLDNITPYDPNKKFNEEEQQKINRMKELESQILDLKTLEEVEANLPF